MDPGTKCVENLLLLKPIGKGAFGEIYLSQIKGKQGYLATKKISKQHADQPSHAKYLRNELSILKNLRHHRNIVKLIDFKETYNNYYIVMELCNGGSLKDCLKKYQKKTGKPFTEEIVQYLMRQIIDVMKYVHSLGIIHRDLKLDNILVKFNNDSDKNNLNMMKATIKIIDFGCATYMNDSNLVYSTLGTPINMAPTVVNKMNYNQMGINTGNIGYNQKADIWSLGTICYEMLIGQPVFNAKSLEELVYKVQNGTYKVPTYLSKEVISFLNGMLQINSENRLNCEELSRHYFLIKDTKDFKKIDLRAVSGNIQGNKININANLNNTIWSVFEDSNTLINIPSNYIMAEPIKQVNQINLQSPISQDIAINKVKNFPMDNVNKGYKKMNSAKNQNYNIANNEFNPIKNINNDIYGWASSIKIPENSLDKPEVINDDDNDKVSSKLTNDDYQFLDNIPFMKNNEQDSIVEKSKMAGITSNRPPEEINTIGVPPPDKNPKKEVTYTFKGDIFGSLAQEIKKTDKKKKSGGYTSGIGGYEF